MRHGKKFNHLSRKKPHREAMLANMACSLIEHKRIKTTLAKAKALRVYIEPLITKSKKDTTHSRRVVFSYLKQKEAISELFGDISTKVMNRNGGYTRILRLNNRLGDNAQMCFIELVDYNEEYITDKPKRKKSRRRSRKGSEKNKDISQESLTSSVSEEALVEEAPVEETSAEEVPVEEAPVEEAPVEEAPVEGTSAEEVPVEETSVEEDPVEEAPVEETSVEEAPVSEDNPSEETSEEEESKD